MKTLTKQRSVALALLAVVGATTFGGATLTPAEASSKTWKKVAIGAGAVTAYGLLTHKGKVATIGGLATAGSYLKYRSERKKEKKHRTWYKKRYGYNYKHHYRR